MKTQDLTLHILDVTKTYRGGTGCACGCAGNYYSIGEQDDFDQLLKHVKYINKNIDRALYFDGGVEVFNPSGTRVTRAYIKKMGK